MTCLSTSESLMDHILPSQQLLKLAKSLSTLFPLEFAPSLRKPELICKESCRKGHANSWSGKKAFLSTTRHFIELASTGQHGPRQHTHSGNSHHVNMEGLLPHTVHSGTLSLKYAKLSKQPQAFELGPSSQKHGAGSCGCSWHLCKTQIVKLDWKSDPL